MYLVQFISHLFSAEENCKTCTYAEIFWTYASVIIFGIGVTGILYASFPLTFPFGDTPEDFFQYGSDKCINHEKVQDLLGEPVKAYGLRTRRHASKHVK